MRPEQDIVDIHESLQLGFFAEQALMALASAERSNAVSEQQSRVFNDAAAFMKGVTEGQHVLKADRLSENAVESASAYSTALKAALSFGDTALLDPGIDDVFARIAAAMTKLAEGALPGGPDRATVRSFFACLSRASFADTGELLRTEGRSEQLWRIPSN